MSSEEDSRDLLDYFAGEADAVVARAVERLSPPAVDGIVELALPAGQSIAELSHAAPNPVLAVKVGDPALPQGMFIPMI